MPKTTKSIPTELYMTAAYSEAVPILFSGLDNTQFVGDDRTFVPLFETAEDAVLHSKARGGAFYRRPQLTLFKVDVRDLNVMEQLNPRMRAGWIVTQEHIPGSLISVEHWFINKVGVVISRDGYEIKSTIPVFDFDRLQAA